MEEKVYNYTAKLKLNVEQLSEYIEKMEQLITHLERARDLLQELKEFELKPFD